MIYYDIPAADPLNKSLARSLVGVPDNHNGVTICFF